MGKLLIFCCQQRYCGDTDHHINSRFVKVLISPVLTTLICLTATCATTNAQSETNVKSIPAFSQQLHPSPLPGALFYGNQISFNGRTFAGTWLQRRRTEGSVGTYLSDATLKQFIGVDLLNTNSPDKQPVRWFSASAQPIVLASLLAQGYRYLDITRLAQTAGWQIQPNGNTLVISTPSAKVIDIRHSRQQPSGQRIVLDLDRPTLWQIQQEVTARKLPLSTSPEVADTQTLQTSALPSREWTLTLDGIASSTLATRYDKDLSSSSSVVGVAPQLQSLIQQLQVVNNQTIIRLNVASDLVPKITTLSAPHRLVIDFLPEALVERSIAWAPGLHWRQQFINIERERFPVFWLEVNPRATGIRIRPIWTNPSTLVGTAPLHQTAQNSTVIAAINGGFFNRNNRLPLGAIRQDGQWLSSPILHRGAIAWNDSGETYLGRLTLKETLISSNNQRFPIQAINSGYVQNGIARYTLAWGHSYTPLTDNEIILIIQNNQIVGQQSGGKTGEIGVAIPKDGYILTLRGHATSHVAQLPVGSFVRTTDVTSPVNFNRFPHILGAGPLLLQNRQIVLNAKDEKFSHAFASQKAVRSGICTTTKGNLIIAAVHNRAGGAGPSLTEHARIMQQLGCVNALNLDGGSSTSLYLGGQLLDRPSSTAARVHNGIGIFLEHTQAVQSQQSQVFSKPSPD